jgi:integrase
MNRIETFLSTFSSKATVKAYRWALARFFESVSGHNDAALEKHAEEYFSQKRDVEADIEKFFVIIKDKPPKTVRLMLAAVKSFFIENDVELPQKFWRKLIRRVRGTRALTLDKVPSNVELRRILMHCPLQGRALFLLLASSGMRIGEALKLKAEDIDTSAHPWRISIRGEYTKTGNSRIAFTSKEAEEAIQEWLKVKPAYLAAASKKSHLYAKQTEDEHLFPFENNTAYFIWTNALRKSGYLKKDVATHRQTLHPHVLRKFFRTKLGTVIPVDVAEALMGHEGYLTEVYRRYTTEDLAKFYLQGEPALFVLTEAEEVAKLRVEVEDKNKQLQTVMNGLATENLDLRQRVAVAEKDLAEMKSLIEKFLAEKS